MDGELPPVQSNVTILVAAKPLFEKLDCLHEIQK